MSARRGEGGCYGAGVYCGTVHGIRPSWPVELAAQDWIAGTQGRLRLRLG
jgi:hypothetical protein